MKKLKKSKSIMFLFVYLHKLLERCCIFFIKTFFPVDKTVVVFRSTPDYSDNARALAEYMVENGYTKKYSIFFDVENKEKYSNKIDDIIFISAKSKYGRYKLGSIYRLFTAGCLMSTHDMIIPKSLGRDNQLLVRLWHGCSFKDKNIWDGKSQRPFDVALVTGDFFVKTKAYFWNVDEKFILPLGYPRYDWLKMKDEEAQRLIDSYKISHDTKIVLWMPTFRIDKRGKCNESNNITQFPLIDNINKWKELDKLCVKLNIILLVKLHPFQPEYGIPYNVFVNIKKIDNQVFDELDIPMYKFVALTDALISDYSSIAIDYLIVNRPIAYALEDYKKYKETRGFLVDNPLIYMPGHHLYCFDDLKIFMKDLSEGKDFYRAKREHVRDKLVSNSDNYCKSILDRLSIYYP